MLNWRILGLIWRGTAYFVANNTTIFLPGSGDSDWSASCRTRVTHFFWRQIVCLFVYLFPQSQIKSLKTQNVQIFLFDMFLPNYKSLSWIMNAFPRKKRCPISMAFWHLANWLTNLPLFQGARPDHVWVESLSCCFSRELVIFVRLREWVLTQGTWHVLLQSENVFELGGITIFFINMLGTQDFMVRNLWACRNCF